MATAAEMEDVEVGFPNGKNEILEKEPLNNEIQVLPSQEEKVISIEDGIKLMSCLPQQPPVMLSWEDISYSVSLGRRKGAKMVLKNLCGRCIPGELVAIMGPSGAGKTSLLNILTGYCSDGITGQIMVNGEDRDIQLLRKLSCFITSDDHLISVLTVEECLIIASNLKIPNSVPGDKKKKIVGALISLLGMEECRSTRSAALSSGQKKRLCIGMELVNNPSVLFFDEPTSGLDSSSSFQCVSLLKALAKGGRTVICTIHQPSGRIFELFDKLYLVGNGYCFYDGYTSNLIEFLSRHGYNCPPYHNLADYVLEVVSGEYGPAFTNMINSVAEGWKNEDFTDISALKFGMAHLDVAEPVSMNGKVFHDRMSLNKKELRGFATSSWNQFCVLLKRTFLAILRDPLVTHIRLGAHIFLGLIIGLLYGDVGNNAANIYNNTAFLFLTLLIIIFAAMMPTLLTFPLEKFVFFREHHNSWYSAKMYYLAKTMADIPFQVLFPLIYCSIVYWMTDQRQEGHCFALFCAVCIVTSLVAQAFGLVIGAATRVDLAVFMAPTSSILFVLFSGFFITVNRIPSYLSWLIHLSFIKYSFEALFLTTFGLNRGVLPCKEMFCLIQSPKYFVKSFGMDQAELYIDFIALVCFFIGFRILGYMVLKWKLRQRN